MRPSPAGAARPAFNLVTQARDAALSLTTASTCTAAPSLLFAPDVGQVRGRRRQVAEIRPRGPERSALRDCEYQ